MSKLNLTVLVLAFTVGALFAEDKTSRKPDPTKPQSAVSDSADGEKKFQIHCGRCHTPPDEIPPAVAGTVLRHMRVRANLSKEEEQQILRYIRP